MHMNVVPPSRGAQLYITICIVTTPTRSKYILTVKKNRNHISSHNEPDVWLSEFLCYSDAFYSGFEVRFVIYKMTLKKGV